MATMEIVDSHTAGEPTRVVIAGGPELGAGPLAERVQLWKTTFDHYRSAIVNEPRGSDVVVGALLCEPVDRTCTTGVIFFNNVGYLGMCGHGTIGVVETLRHLGRLQPGTIRLETPVGVVTATLHQDRRVSIENVPSYRQQADVVVDIPGIGRFVGDVAWAGNWFYLVHTGNPLPLTSSNVDALTDLAWRLRQGINAGGFPEVDHVELFGPAEDPGGHSRNFVLCPGKAYDRSPCGTGTSAKLACLAAKGDLAPGDTWVQESILGTRFEARYVWHDAQHESITPTITGRAYVNAETRLLIDERDPFAWGIRR